METLQQREEEEEEDVNVTRRRVGLQNNISGVDENYFLAPARIILMAQANPAAADAGTELKVTIDGMKQRTGVTCEVVGISTCDNVRVIFLGTAHVSKVLPPPLLLCFV